MTNEKECCSDCRVRTDLGEYCKYPKCSCHIQSVMTNEKELRESKEELSEEIVNYFMNKGATVSKQDYNFVLSKFHFHTKEVVENFEVKWMFEKSGQCSSLYRAHPETEWEKGWNSAVESMLKYIPQPSLKDYDNAITLLKEDNNK